MTLRHRGPRAAVSALLLATAIGTGGMTGMTSVLAVDPAPTVQIAGHLVDDAGAPLAGVALIVAEELPPDGGLAGFQATTGSDGGFSVAVEPWGTAEAPASLTFKVAPDATFQVTLQSCTQTWGVTLSDTRQLALADVAAAPDPVALVASTKLLGEVCGTTGTPRPTAAPNSGNHRADPTPPATDTSPALAAHGDQPEAALLIGFAVGLIAAALLLIQRPGARRRD